MQVKGTLLQILKMETGVSKAGKEWKKQDFVIETNEQFPKKVCFTLFNDKVNLLVGIPEGEELEISFDIESREFNNKWYHNLNAWKIERTVHKTESTFTPPFKEEDIPAEFSGEEPGDLPF